MSKPFLKILMLVIVVINLSCGQDSKDGTEAYDRKDYGSALSQASKGAKEGNGKAQYNLGKMHDNGYGVPKNYQEAVKWYRLAADQGVAEAQFYLGVMYQEGRGVPQNYQEAVKLWRLAADQGVAEAQFYLGVMYFLGEGGGPKDRLQDNLLAYVHFSLAGSLEDETLPDTFFFDKQSFRKKSYEKLSTSQRQEAQKMAAREFEKIPKGMKKNEKLQSYRLRADQGDAAAQYSLGWMYDAGRGVPQNYEQAVKWYRLAADQGFAMAQSSLGHKYRLGDGVPDDNLLAYVHFSLASSLMMDKDELEEVQVNRDKAYEKLTPSQRAKGEKMTAIEFEKIQNRMKN